MEEENKATETTVETAQTIAPEEDLETRLAQIEAEKQKAIEERDNYKKAYLKEASKTVEPVDEEDDERYRRIAREELANSKILELAREQDELLRQAVKENKELKLAQLNKKEPPAAMGGHSEGVAVRDTMVTPEQMEAFKARGWSDKDIERYKKNLLKNTR